MDCNKNESVSMQKGKRIPYLDYAKIVVTFLVVYGHLISTSAPERPYIYAFHMPFFFLVSGLLHKTKGTMAEGIIDSFRKLFIPALFFMAAYRLYQFGWNWLYDDINVAASFSQFLNDLCLSAKSVLLGDHDNMGNGVCWFLFALFWHKVLMTIWDKKKTLFGVAIIAMLVVLALRMNLLFVGQALKNLPFYMVGYQLSNRIYSAIENMKYPLFVGLSLLIVSGVLTYFNGAVSFLAMSMVGNLPMPLNAVVCYSNAFIASMGMLLICSCFKKEYNWSRQLSMSLLSIVGLQMAFWKSWLIVMGGSIIPVNVFVAIVIMTCCFMIHTLLAQYMPWSVGVIKKK